jgi:hypothetical protein
MASSGSAAHIANVSGDTSSESGTSARSAPAERRSLTRTRRHWTTAAVVTPANVQSELDHFGPLCKSETKAGKSYFKCKLHNRFSCNMIIRTVPEMETGFICIQTCGLEHQHDAASERFGRGLSTQVKESIEEITKFNLKIRPATLHRMLLSEPYSYADNIVPYTKVRGHLHRIRGRASELYMEYSIAGLWNAVNNNQRVTASSTDGGRFYYLRPACEALVDVESGAGGRVQVFASTDTLLRCVDELDHTVCKMQLVIDSKHRVLLNDYPITVVGILDAGQQFHMVALAVSNREDEEFFYCLLQAVKDSLQVLELYPTFTCTMSDNSDAIQRALRRCFPMAVIGNCIFHLQQNIKKNELYGTCKCPKQFLSMLVQNGPFVGEMRTSRLPGMPSIGCQVYNTSTSSTYALKFSSHILKPREIFNLRIYCVRSTLQTEKKAGPGV